MRPLHHTWIAFSLLLFFLPANDVFAQSETLKIEVQAGKVERQNVPVRFAVPEEWDATSLFLVTDQETMGRTIAQRWNKDTAVFMLDFPLRPGRKRIFEVAPYTSQPVSLVHLTMDSSAIRIGVSDREVLQYHTDTVAPPPGSPAYYQRSGFIHPLYSPERKVLTDGFPAGHTHQHGIFFTWVNTTFRGDFTDFWNQQQETGTVRHVAVLDTVSGPVFARFRVRLEHVSLKHGPVLEEKRTVTVYSWYDRFLLDIESEQRAVTADTLFIEEYHYGGLAFRGSEQWNEADSTHFQSDMQVLTSEGMNRAAANHTRPKWVAGYGAIDSTMTGVAVLDHPSNFRFPQPVRVHPEMPYFCFAPMVTGAFTIAPGQPYRSRYRLLSYNGAPEPGRLESVWQDFATPVQVFWRE